MPDFTALNNQELMQHKEGLQNRYREYQSRGLNLDITRGKPCPDQLDLALDMLDCIDSSNYLTAAGTDCRNYGGLDGIPEAKMLFAEYLEVQPEELIIGGNSSLNLMHERVMHQIEAGVPADNELLRLHLQVFGKQRFGLGDAVQSPVIAAVGTGGGQIIAAVNAIQHIQGQVQLVGTRLAAGNVEIETAGLIFAIPVLKFFFELHQFLVV